MMAKSIYSIDRQRHKTEFTNPDFFKIGDDFRTEKGEIIFTHYPDELRGLQDEYNQNRILIKTKITRLERI